jgi:peroxiredoxin
MKKLLLMGAAAAMVLAATAPSFKAPNLDNKWAELKDLAGCHATLITFWATWCKSCKEELKALEPLYQKYKDQGFAVIAVNTDGPRTQAQVRTDVTSNRLSFTVILDKNGDIARLYKVGAWPTSFLLDSLNNIVSSRIGYHPGDEKKLENELLQLLPPPEFQSSGK